MGFGAALAMGLVQGFTKNIEEERKNRQEDYKKLDDINAIIMDNALKGNTYNASLISAMVKDARGELDDKERISIFGAQTPRVGVDLTAVAPLLTEKDDEEDKYAHSFAGGAIKFKNDTPGLELMSEINVAMMNPQIQDAFTNATPAEQSMILSLANSSRQTVVNKARGELGENFRSFNSGEDASIYPGLNWLINTSHDNRIKPQDAPTAKKQALPDSDLNVLGSNFDALVNGGVEVSTVGLKNPDLPDYTPWVKFDEQYMPGLEIVAKSVGVDDPRFALAAWQKTYSFQLGMNAQQQKELFISAVKLSSLVPNAQALDPDKEGLTAPAETLMEILGTLRKVGGTDVRKAALILAPYMDYAKLPTSSTMAFGEIQNVRPESVREYVLRYELGTDVSDPKAVAKDYTAYVDHADNVTNTYRQLTELEERIMSAPDAPQAYELFKDSMQTIFSFSDGVVGGIVRDGLGFFSDFSRATENTYKNDGTDASLADVTDKENYTTSYDALLKQRIRDAGDEAAQEIEAMKITLAFKMARADDPSGRLSNQDIEAQYVKLGKSFATKGQALAALRVTIKDFKRKNDKVEVLSLLMKGGADRTSTDRDFQIVDGVRTANNMFLMEDASAIPQAAQTQTTDGVSEEDFVDADMSRAFPELQVTIKNGITYYRNPETAKISPNASEVRGVNANTSGAGPTPQTSLTSTTNDSTVVAAPEESATPVPSSVTTSTHYPVTDSRGLPDGNNITGYKLQDGSGNVLPGRWKKVGDRFEQVTGK